MEQMYSYGDQMFDRFYGDVENFAATNAPLYQYGVESATAGMMDNEYLSSIQSGTNLGMTGLGGIVDGSNAGMQSMESLMNPTGNPYLQSEIDSMYGSINKNLTENILPAQRGEESVLDQYGGSRGAITEGMAMDSAITQGAEAEQGLRYDAYTSDMDRALQASLGYTGATADASTAYTGAGMTADQIMADKYNAVPEMLTSAMNLGMSEYQLPFDYLGNLANLYGSPTVLGEGSSSQSGFNMGFLT